MCRFANFFPASCFSKYFTYPSCKFEQCIRAYLVAQIRLFGALDFRVNQTFDFACAKDSAFSNLPILFSKMEYVLYFQCLEICMYIYFVNFQEFMWMIINLYYKHYKKYKSVSKILKFAIAVITNIC